MKRQLAFQERKAFRLNGQEAETMVAVAEHSQWDVRNGSKPDSRALAAGMGAKRTLGDTASMRLIPMPPPVRLANQRR